MIHAKGLARTFKTRSGTVEAVRGVDFDVEPGELVGFLGPNGAGKTTTLRMLTTLLQPTSGSATVAGHDLASDPISVRRSIGYVGQGGSSTPELIVGEELALQGRFYGLSNAEAQQRGGELAAALDLAGLDKRKFGTLSGGQKRRLDIAMGLIHSPQLVFLDEPTTGLDPQSRANLWNHIRSLNADHGMTVFLTTHYLEEADALCDRLLVIDKGQIVAEGSPDELKRQVSGDSVELSVHGGAEGAERAVSVAKRLDGAHEFTVDGESVRFRVPRGDEALPTLLRNLDAEGISLASVGVHRPTLDDVFLAMTGRSLRDAEEGA
ncbi:ATP-binding cassette domain-containing protein [Pseudonocardiaceae bacterium YIM PH 21723]|nr:ATP-binding cassette domain-containing protein [Pseudonocardiaceae bacterium YIM PH 21723]